MATKHQNNKDVYKTDSFGKQKRKQSKHSSNNKYSIDSIIDDKAKKDICAVVLIVLGVALFAVAIVPTNAPITSFIVNVLKFVFGIGVYISPFVFIAIGVSFFFRMDRQKITIRVSIGLTLIFISILTIVSLSSPTIADSKPEGLFDVSNITSYGGILGSALAWLGYTLLGSLVSTIIMIGIIIVGLIVVGLSITNIVARLNERREDIERENSLRLDNNKDFGLFGKSKHEKNPNANIPTNALFNSDGNVLVDNDGNVLTSDSKIDSNTETIAVDPLLIDSNGSVRNQDDILKERAIQQNTNKKPGLKTRILGFRKTNIEINDFSDSLKQGKTKRFDEDDSKIESKKNKEKIDDSQSQKTKYISDRAKKLPKSSKSNLVGSASVGSSPKPSEGFVLPSFDILEKNENEHEFKQSKESLKEVAENLQKTLGDFGISANVVGWVPGPTVTLFKVDLPSGVRVSRITALNDDIALALAAPGVRVFAPIPGTTYVGIEVPNEERQTVLLSDVLKKAKAGPLQLSIGKDVEGKAIVTNLAKMPHLLIGGTTGSGKSVSINAMIMSILMRATPSEVRLILIDPKRVEFTPYNGIPHLYVPVVTEPKEAASALSWGVAEMESRLKTFSKIGVRNIDAYNAKVQKMSESELQETGLEEFPYIVIVIDELADLMMAIGKEVEYSISRIAQLARAAGIHLIVATQRPSTNVVTGLIKANITCRIAFNVASGIDSRVILDTGGAESLIGLGDMLFNKPEFSKPVRIQACYVSENEISNVVEHLKSQGEPEYHNDILKTNIISISDMGSNSTYNNSADNDDSLIWEAAEMVVNAQHGSTSSLQRRFKIGYARAGRIMDMLEEKGIVGPQNGSKPREVLVDSLELEGIKALENYDSKNSIEDDF